MRSPSVVISQYHGFGGRECCYLAHNVNSFFTNVAHKQHGIRCQALQSSLIPPIPKIMYIAYDCDAHSSCTHQHGLHTLFHTWQDAQR